MKKILFACLAALLVSCGSTESKIKSAIKENEKSYLGNGEHIEMFSVDSVDYYVGSLRSIYTKESIICWNLINESDKSYSLLKDYFIKKIDSIHSADNVSVSVATDKLFHTDSFLIMRTELLKKTKILDSLADNADTTEKYFIVNYVVKVNTNKSSSIYKRTFYLTQGFDVYKPPFDWRKD